MCFFRSMAQPWNSYWESEEILMKWSLGAKQLDTIQDDQDGKKSSQNNMCLRNNTEDLKETVHEHPLQTQWIKID